MRRRRPPLPVYHSIPNVTGIPTPIGAVVDLPTPFPHEGQSDPRPANAWQLRTSGNSIGAPPGPPRHPVPQGGRERKVRALSGPAYQLIRSAIHNTSEALDYVDVFHDALPKHLQVKDGKAADKAAAVLEHFDELDLNAVMLGLVKNEVTDRITGRFIGSLNKTVSGTGSTYGTGLRTINSNAGAAASQTYDYIFDLIRKSET